MPGCTCGKRAGFIGRHKKRCPCRYVQALDQQASTLLSESQRRLYKRCPYGCGLVREEKLPGHINRIHPSDSPLLNKAREIRPGAPKKTDALCWSVSAGAFESNRRKH
jgi:hypothetical protein